MKREDTRKGQTDKSKQNCETLITLEETLQQKTCAILTIAARDLGMDPSSNMRKRDLIAMLLIYFEGFLDDKFIKVAATLNNEEIELLEKIVKNGGRLEVSKDIKKIQNMNELFFLHVVRPQKGKGPIILTLPSIVLLALKKNFKYIQTLHEAFDIIEHTIFAGLNLYGTLTISEVIELVQRYIPSFKDENIPPQLVNDTFHFLHLKDLGYDMDRDNLFHWLLLDVDHEYLESGKAEKDIMEFLNERSQNPRWYPSTAVEFYSFDRDEPICNQKVYDEICDKILLHSDVSRLAIENFLDAMAEDRQRINPASLQRISDILTNCFLKPETTKDELQDIITGLASYFNSLHLWRLNGNTPEHLLNKLQSENPDFTPYQEPIQKKKIGRNDPCPYGSGKKYKKCCGRFKSNEDDSFTTRI